MLLVNRVITFVGMDLIFVLVMVFITSGFVCVVGVVACVVVFFFQEEDGIREAHYGLEFRRVLFRSRWEGKMPSSHPARKTVSNSSPLAAWMVMIVTLRSSACASLSMTSDTCSRNAPSVSYSSMARASSLRFSSRPALSAEIGSASCRERVGQDGWISVVGGTLK